ncbi:peptidoglycan editing factor PgeF [Noviherbaspirillum sp. ST9]|uniref:peptidoglycan editing factor PgeF n=1 Tax=Noviherbaspirillum sp. ST9 TaxID=3401606 RepID=UPI003B587D0F
MELIVPDWACLQGSVGALSTTRRGGRSNSPYDDGEGGGGLNLGVHVGDDPENVRRNRELLKTILPSEPAWLSQVHGVQVVDAASVNGVPPDADASISTVPGIVCAIQTADCLPVLLCDRGGRAVGAAHAGWRGLAGGVLENTVSAMRDARASDILAWLGPAIGPQSFEVGQDVFDAFTAKDGTMAAAFEPIAGSTGKYLADIYALARRTLVRAGVTQVSGGGMCTVTEKRRFYSYRRDKVTGRMASLIWLK